MRIMYKSFNPSFQLYYNFPYLLITQIHLILNFVRILSIICTNYICLLDYSDNLSVLNYINNNIFRNLLYFIFALLGFLLIYLVLRIIPSYGSCSPSTYRTLRLLRLRSRRSRRCRRQGGGKERSKSKIIKYYFILSVSLILISILVIYVLIHFLIYFNVLNTIYCCDGSPLPSYSSTPCTPLREESQGGPAVQENIKNSSFNNSDYHKINKDKDNGSNVNDRIDNFVKSVYACIARENYENLAPYLNNPNAQQDRINAVASGQIKSAILHNNKAPILRHLDLAREAAANNYSFDIKIDRGTTFSSEGCNHNNLASIQKSPTSPTSPSDPQSVQGANNLNELVSIESIPSPIKEKEVFI